MKRHTHSHTHGERILIDEIAYASALRQVSPMWKIFVSLYSLFLCLSSHTWVISVLILCAMLIAMTAIGKTRWHHIIRLMQIPLAFVILGCIMILLQVSHHGEKMLLAIPVGSWYFGVTAESVHQFGQVFLQCLAAVSCLYFLSTSTPMTELFTALRRMHIPGFLVEMMELVYRYIFGCGLYTLYCREWLQFLILLVAEFGCFLLITAGTVIVEAVEWFSGWIAEL